MTRILVDHMPVNSEECFAAGLQNSGNWTCGFRGYVVVCDPKKCPYLTEARGEMRKEKQDERV